jgi:hypothetical protein
MRTLHCATPPVLPLPPTGTRWWPALRDAVRQAWGARRERRARDACWRALEHLDDRTLQDLGLAERLPYRSPTLPTHDFLRGRW